MLYKQQTETDEPVRRDPAARYTEGKGGRLDTARNTDASWREDRRQPLQAAFDRLTRLKRGGQRWVERLSPILWTGATVTLLLTLLFRLMFGFWFMGWLRPTGYVFLVLGFPVFVGALVRDSAGALLRALRWWARREAIEIVEAEEASEFPDREGRVGYP